MSKINISPWLNGVKEMLEYSIELEQKESEDANRIAFILVDNSIELIIKTYLSLPKRISSLEIPRKERKDAIKTYPKMLDLLELKTIKAISFNLGELEMYHRTRNMLYHEGALLTVSKDKVEIFRDVALVLVSDLFGNSLFPIEKASTPRDHEPSRFIYYWSQIEKGLINYEENLIDAYGRTPNSMEMARILFEENKFDKVRYNNFKLINDVKNKVVHEVNSNYVTKDIWALMLDFDKWLTKTDPNYYNSIFKDTL